MMPSNLSSNKTKPMPPNFSSNKTKPILVNLPSQKPRTNSQTFLIYKIIKQITKVEPSQFAKQQNQRQLYNKEAIVWMQSTKRKRPQCFLDYRLKTYLVKDVNCIVKVVDFL
jgi:hypothetical protein